MMRDIRSRQPNYTNHEKMTLLNVIETYKSIILNKKTDHTTWKDKETAWQNIEKNFNAISPTGVYRTADQLRSYFNNLKKKTKKDAADQKLSIKKTGSGSSESGVDVSDPAFDLTLALLNEKTVYGLENKFDSDHATKINEHTNNELNNDNWNENITQELSSNTLQQQDVIIEVDESVLQNNIPLSTHAINVLNTPSLNWKKYTPAHLQNPKSKKLCSGITMDTTENIKEWTKKRRPAMSTERKELTDLYREIAEEKLAFYKTQNEELAIKRIRDEDDYKNRIKREEEEHELKKQKLLLDIKLKNKQIGLE